MKTKILMGFSIAMFSYAATVQASSGFQITLNTQLGSTYGGGDCFACHVGNVGSSSTATLPMATTYKTARGASDFTLIASSDSDGDGYANKYEATAVSVEFNDAAVSPFTKATPVNTDANVRTLADTTAVSAAFIDANGLAGTGETVLGGIKVTLNQADTIYFKAGGVDATSKLYMVDAAGVGTLVANTAWSANTDGSLQILTFPGGATSYVAVVATPAAAVITTAQDLATVGGCVTSSATTPLMMLLAMLSLGFFVRRRKG